MDRSQMQFVLTHRDGEQRLKLWNPRGFWELAEPIGYHSNDPEPTHFMELPKNPDDPSP